MCTEWAVETSIGPAHVVLITGAIGICVSAGVDVVDSALWACEAIC